MAELFETARGTVHAWQCDHMGHVNLRAYGEFFEQSLWQVFNRIGITPSVLREGRLFMAGVQQNFSYKQELLAGDVIEVRSGVAEIRERVIRMVHEMRNLESGAICATCELTAVCMDGATRKSRPFPPEVAASARALLINDAQPA